MPFYHSLGEIPPKRHTIFKNLMVTYTMSNYLEQSVLTECQPTHIIAIDLLK